MGFSSGSLRSVRLPCAGRRSTAVLCQDTVQRHLPPEATSGSSERSRIPRGRRGTGALEELDRGGGSSRSAAADPAQPLPQPAPCAHGEEAPAPARLPNLSEGAGCSALAVSLQLG